MSVKIRLQRHGSKKRPFYFIVVADARAPRDGKFIQKLGTYNPQTQPATIQLDRQRALDWLGKGAQPTDTVRKILSYKGVLYLKHLLRGVSLGLFDEATAMTKFQTWHTEHEAQIRRRQEEAQRERRARRNPSYQRREEDRPLVTKLKDNSSSETFTFLSPALAGLFGCGQHHSTRIWLTPHSGFAPDCPKLFSALLTSASTFVYGTRTKFSIEKRNEEMLANNDEHTSLSLSSGRRGTGGIDRNLLLKAYRLMHSAKLMAETYEANRSITKYVHSTSRGHEAIQLATAFHLKPQDWVSPYYRDDSMLLGMGWTPYELMLQLLTKRDDPFTGGRSYYSHPNTRAEDKPKIIHQSSATGMQTIPTTGVAQGLSYLELTSQPAANGELINTESPTTRASTHALGDIDTRISPTQEDLENSSTLLSKALQLDKFPMDIQRGSSVWEERPVVVCSLGDASVTEGEVSEALQFAALKQLPIIYLIQDNDWGISVSAKESRSMDAYEFAGGFKGLQRIRVDGTDFFESYKLMQEVITDVRENRRPWLVHAKVCLLNHHTSGVRKEFYRSEEDLALHAQTDPYVKFREYVVGDFGEAYIKLIEDEVADQIKEDFERAVASPEPDPATVTEHVFVPTPITEERGERSSDGKEKIIMVDAALFAIRELMEEDERCVLYGQDVGRRLGGVFREAATLAERFGDHRVFNTAIQEAYIIGSTVGMSAVGLKPIVEVQFADYIYPGFNQLVTEISKSCYLSCGKFPVSTIIRVPIGAYGGGGPYHSGSVETTLLSIKGIKIAYPSNAADMKGLMKAAYYDPNPVVMLEHKGLYWSKVPGTEEAKTIEPSRDYVLPFGKAAVALKASDDAIFSGESACVITYGMGVYWAKAAEKKLAGRVEIIDLRTLFPLDEELIFSTVKKHGKCLVLTEEQQTNSFAEALAGRISKACFQWLDAPVEVLGALNLPAVALNMGLEAAMLPSAEKVSSRLAELLGE